MHCIRFFNEVGAADVSLVGGKGANLGEMTRAGFPVPPGFCLTAAAYREFIQASGLEGTIRAALTGVNMNRSTDIDEKTSSIREAIQHQTIPTIMAEEILDGYQHLGREHTQKQEALVPVAVRSSATAEDLPTASFAGQQDTYLNVCGEDELLARVKDCWASLWTSRAVVYRNEQGFDHYKVYLAVVVQAMIQSDVSGILFTANPVTSHRAESVINASWGLGEAIVSGLVNPDTITVDQHQGTIIERQIGTKERTIQYAADGNTVEIETPVAQREVSALTDERALELVALGRQIEEHYGTPQDIEWGYEHNQCHILQARPITTLAQQIREIGPEDEYNRTMFVEIFPDPLSPVFLSVIRPLFKTMLDFTFETWGFKPPQEIDAIGAFYNQPYFNRRYIEAALEPLPAKVRTRLVEQIVNPFGEHDGKASSALSLSYLRLVVSTLNFMIRFPGQLPALITHYQDQVAKVAKLPLETASDEELINATRTLALEDACELMAHDFLMIAVIGRAYQFLGTLLDRYYGDATEKLVARLISGVTGNITMETNKRLWDLAQTAKGSEGVSTVLRKADASSLRLDLEQPESGQAFLEELDGFLVHYGHRESRADIFHPTWVEDLTPVLGFMRGYLDAAEAKSPHQQQARLVSERQKLTHEVMTRIRQDLVGRIVIAPIFRWLLNLTQIHTRERDTMHFELTRLFPPVRRLLFALGHRWKDQDFIENHDDVFFLTLDELADLADARRSVKSEVRQRRAEYQTNQTRPWPDIIRQDQELYAHEADASDIADEDVMRGIAGSPGIARGAARVIRGPEEFGELQPGEILIAPLTNPVWTPLFAIAGGVVTEVGGILSHGAIVAREYGIPAVMSVPGVTTRVSDGQEITIDGNKGVVILVTEEAS